MKQAKPLRTALALQLTVAILAGAAALRVPLLSLVCGMALKTAQSFLPTAALTRFANETANESTTAPPTVPEPTVTEPPDEPAAAPAPEDADFTATPQDVLDRMAAATAAASDEKGGAIVKRTYGTAGVTDQCGVVRIKNTNQTQIDAAALLKERANLTVDKAKPAVLIFHTHTTESFQLTDRDFYAKGDAARSNDPGENMVRVGDEICSALEAAGYTVLHDAQIYDAKYTGAYDLSRAAVQRTLKKYPSIQITLDIHRDAIQLSDGSRVRPVADVQGKPAAQVMIISGCQEEGNNVSGFSGWKQNLIFALQLQRQLETDFPTLTRPLFFCGRRYNMDLTPCSLLIEIGTDVNTLEEAVYSGRCVGTSLARLMAAYETE